MMLDYNDACTARKTTFLSFLFLWKELLFGWMISYTSPLIPSPLFFWGRMYTIFSFQCVREKESERGRPLNQTSVSFPFGVVTSLHTIKFLHDSLVEKICVWLYSACCRPGRYPLLIDETSNPSPSLPTNRSTSTHIFHFHPPRWRGPLLAPPIGINISHVFFFSYCCS